MKKFLLTLLSISILASAAVFADEETANYDDQIMLISEEAEEEEIVSLENAKRNISGVIKSVSDTQIELEDYVLNIDENTYFGDWNLNPVEKLAEGDEVVVIASMMETRSIPAQTYAYFILKKTEEAATAPIYMTVDEVTDEFITSAEYEVSYKDVPVEMFKTKNIVKAEELTTGSEIIFYSDILTMSIPALANPSSIKVLSIAEQKSETMEADFLVAEGILLGTENGLELAKDVTRAETATLLSRISKTQARIDAKPNFTDVPETHWAYETIGWAQTSGIIEGVGNGLFLPNETVSGREIVKMLLSMSGDSEVTIENAYDKGVEAGIVTESVDASVENNLPLTRNEVSVIIYNYINK